MTRSSWPGPPHRGEEPDAERPCRRSRPPSSTAASFRSSALRRRAASAPVVEEAAIWADCVATATAGGMPRKISSGVIRKPPPMPNRPETKPTAAPIARISRTLTGISAMGR